MTHKALIPAAICVSLAWPAMAATTPQSGAGSEPSSGASTQMNNGSANNHSAAATPRISQKLRQSLTQAGYTDISIVPESFMIHAKDKSGNPVMMMVTPTSMTEVTAVNEAPGTSNTQANEAGSGTQSSTAHSSGMAPTSKQ